MAYAVLGIFYYDVTGIIICLVLYIYLLLCNTCVNRVVGGFVTATHQSAESNGHHQPTSTARHLAEFHHWIWGPMSADVIYRCISVWDCHWILDKNKLWNL